MATWTAAAVATLFISSLASFAQVNLPIGTLLPGEKVTLTFDVTITNPFPASATSVTNQGTVSGSNFATVNSDDPQTGPVGDATVTAVFVPPVITSATNATFTVGINGVFNVSRTGSPTPDLFVSGTIPNNIGFNPGTGNLAGTPSIGTGGTYPLIFCSFTVRVMDTEPPSVFCTNITVTATDACSATVTYSQSATDNCGALETTSFTPPSGSAFNLGTNTVQFTAMDVAGNTNTCFFTVTVLPGTLPMLSIAQTDTNAVISWSTNFPCYTLQYKYELFGGSESERAQAQKWISMFMKNDLVEGAPCPAAETRRPKGGF